jgi:6-hydroxytryprostatin B O-methyltransferase
MIPLEGSISYNNISVIASVSEPHLKSVCRMMMTTGVFCEPHSDRIAHTSTSSLLATDPDFAAWARCVSTIKYEASSALAISSASCFGNQQPVISAFNVGSGNPVQFQALFRSGKDPKLSREFGGFLKATQKIYANDPVHVLNGFDWNSIGQATVVDVSVVD